MLFEGFYTKIIQFHDSFEKYIWELMEIYEFKYDEVINEEIDLEVANLAQAVKGTRFQYFFGPHSLFLQISF